MSNVYSEDYVPPPCWEQVVMMAWNAEQRPWPRTQAETIIRDLARVVLAANARIEALDRQVAELQAVCSQRGLP